MVSAVRCAEAGDPGTALEELRVAYGATKVASVLGNGVKALAPVESDSYRTTNRSILAITDIERGEPVSAENTALLRSETNLEPGLPPECYGIILGRKVVRDVRRGAGLVWDDVLS